MKSTMKKMLLPCVAGLLAWGPAALAVEKTLQAVMSPGMDMVVRVDNQQLQASPFFQQLKKTKDQQEIVKVEADVPDFTGTLAKMGIDLDTITDAALGLDFDYRPDPARPPAMAFSLAVTSSKPFDMEMIKEQIKTLAKKENEDIEITPVTLDGVSVLKIKQKEDAAAAEDDAAPQAPGQGGINLDLGADMKETFLAVAEDGKLLLVSSQEKGMLNGIRCLKDNQFTPNPKMKEFYNTTAKSQLCGAFVLTDAMKQKIQEKQAAKPANGQGDPMGGIEDAFSSMQGVGWFVNCEKDAVVNVKVGLGNAQDATKGTAALNAFLGMMRGVMAMNQGPADPQTQMMTQIFNALQVKNADNNVFFTLPLPANFIAEAQKMAEQKATQFLAPPMEE